MVIKGEKIMDSEICSHSAAQIATSLTSSVKLNAHYKNVFLMQAAKLGMLLIFPGPLPTNAPLLPI